MRTLLIAAAICAFPFAASADMTGKQLKEVCQQHPQKSEMTSLCTGYLWGSFDMARALKAACEPPGVAGTRLIDMTLKHVLANPDQQHLPAPTLILDVYRREFPCPR